MTITELAMAATWEDAASTAVKVTAGYFRAWYGNNFDKDEALAEAGWLFMQAYLSFDGRGVFCGWVRYTAVKAMSERAREFKERQKRERIDADADLFAVQSRPEPDYEALAERLSGLSDDGIQAVAAAVTYASDEMRVRDAVKVTKATLRAAGWPRLRIEAAFDEVRKCLEGRD